MIDVEKSDARHPDGRSIQVTEMIRRRHGGKGVEHTPCCQELVTKRRRDVMAEIWIVGFNNQMIARMRRVLKHDMNVTVALTFNPRDDSTYPVHTELLFADPM